MFKSTIKKRDPILLNMIYDRFCMNRSVLGQKSRQNYLSFFLLIIYAVSGAEMLCI